MKVSVGSLQENCHQVQILQKNYQQLLLLNFPDGKYQFYEYIKISVKNAEVKKVLTF